MLPHHCCHGNSRPCSSRIPYPASIILHPISRIHHLISLTWHPAFLIPHSASLTLHPIFRILIIPHPAPSSRIHHPAFHLPASLTHPPASLTVHPASPIPHPTPHTSTLPLLPTLSCPILLGFFLSRGEFLAAGGVGTAGFVSLGNLGASRGDPTAGPIGQEGGIPHRCGVQG